MRKKRFLAVLMATSMVLGNSVVALAEEKTTSPAQGSLDGTVTVEGVVDPDVFDVVLPTVSSTEVKDAFNFVMDPQGLIEATNAARYTSTNAATGGLAVSASGFDPGTLYFARTVSDGSTPKIGPSSNELTIINKGTMDVNVSVKATIDSASFNEAVKLVSGNISSGDAPSVYLALKDETSEEPIMKGTGASLEAVISGNDGAYNISWNGTEYVKQASANATFSDYSFYLSGNSGGNIQDWLKNKDKINGADAKVHVTWTVTPDGVAASPFSPSTLRLDTGTPQQADVTLPTGATTITKVEFKKADGSGYAALTAEQYKYEDGKFWFTAPFRTMMVNGGVTSLECRVTFSNNTTATVMLVKP